MKLNETTIGPAAAKIAKRWRLDIGDRVAETPRAYVYRVERREGPAALKIYKRIGAAGEGAGIQFLRNLDTGIGVEVYRTTALRSAVLMEWLEGEPLDHLAKRGKDKEATLLAGQVAHAIGEARFRYPFLYKRIAPSLVRDLRLCQTKPDGSEPHPDLAHTIALVSHLIVTTPQEQVVHGDLRFSNIFLTAQGPRLIDPKGFRADPAFEFSKTLIDPYAGTSLAAFETRIAQRAPVLANAIQTSPKRIIQWAAVLLAHTVIYGGRKRKTDHPLTPYLATLLSLSAQ
ncbi:MAG: aminoglycoside phosphotransferase family protein [Pseudomonadota bacterium]